MLGSYIDPGTPRYCGLQGTETNMHVLVRKGQAKLPPAKSQP